MNNKTAGTRFEKEFAGLLADNWFWVHLFQDNKNGQPCDVIAARNGHAYLFDCKDCQGDYFPLSRIEENQYNAMRLFEMTGNGRGKFAIRFSGQEIYLVDYWQLGALQGKGVNRISRMDCHVYGEGFRAWLDAGNRMDGWSDEHAFDNRE